MEDRNNWGPYSYCALIGLALFLGAISYFTNVDPLITTALAGIACVILWILLTPFKAFRSTLYKVLAATIVIIFVGGFLMGFVGIIAVAPAVAAMEFIEEGNWGASFFV